jgi:predicted metal-dependent enzyme (double-stranded beta helix superfamily)
MENYFAVTPRSGGEFANQLPSPRRKLMTQTSGGGGMFSVQHVIGSDLVQRLSAASRQASPDYLVAARLTLESLLRRPDCLAGVELARKSGGYARTLLFGDDQLSLWAMVWDVGAKTSIHDHHCSCCFGVLTGALTEIEFKAIDEATAIMTSQAVRTARHIACMTPTGPNLHQVVNDQPREAISLHIYGYDPATRDTSVHREYKLAPK